MVQWYSGTLHWLQGGSKNIISLIFIVCPELSLVDAAFWNLVQKNSIENKFIISRDLFFLPVG